MGETAAVFSSISSVATGASSIFTGISNAQAIESQGRFQKQQFDFNAKIADRQAKQAIERGDTEALDLKKQAKRLIGSQRVSLAAQGIEIDEGSALEVQEDTAKMAELDAIRIKNNAQREAFGYKLSALDLSGQGVYAYMNAQSKAQSSIISGGLSGLGYFSQGVSTLSRNLPTTKGTK